MADVELVGSAYETMHAASGCADLRALAPLLAVDFRLVNPSDAVRPGTREGLREWEEVVRQLEHAYERLEYEVHELRDAGDSVVALLTMRARGRESGKLYVEEEAHLWRTRSGEVTGLAWFHSHREALEAAGLG